MNRRLLIAAFTVLGFALGQPMLAQPTHVEGLGSVYFPNSGAENAQDAFIRGVLLAHSFEYQSAAEAFRSLLTDEAVTLLAADKV